MLQKVVEQTYFSPASVTFSILSSGQSEGLHLHRNQLDLQLRRHQEQILRFALETPSVSCFEQLLVVHQTLVRLIYEEWDVKWEALHFLCLQQEIHQLCFISLLSMWSYWDILCRQVEETREPSSWWRRKDSSPTEISGLWTYAHRCPSKQTSQIKLHEVETLQHKPPGPSDTYLSKILDLKCKVTIPQLPASLWTVGEHPNHTQRWECVFSTFLK